MQPLPLKIESIGRASMLAPVKGFLYAVRPRQYYQIDRWMQNTLYFQRERVEIDVPYREINNFDKRAVSEVKHEIVEAHMHIPFPEYWGPLLDNGQHFKPVKPFVGNTIDPRTGNRMDRPYYYWTKLEAGE